jgi:hypothetical protein
MLLGKEYFLMLQFNQTWRRVFPDAAFLTKPGEEYFLMLHF